MIEDRYGDVRGPDPGDPGTSVSRARSVKRRTTKYVVLDSTWARYLGVRRSGGMYRIARRDLIGRLNELRQVPVERYLIPSAVLGGHDLTANEPQRDDHVVLEAHSHFVEFYETETFLVDSVRDFLTPGPAAGGAAIVVVTDAHRDWFDRALMAAGVELADARRCGRYITLDASEALAMFMVDGMPDAARFRTTIGQLVSGATENAANVGVYGEMVAVLWDEGNVAGAIALEDLWNDLATRYLFSLFCAYPMRAFDKAASTEGFFTICGKHSKVLVQDQGT